MSWLATTESPGKEPLVSGLISCSSKLISIPSGPKVQLYLMPTKKKITTHFTLDNTPTTVTAGGTPTPLASGVEPLLLRPLQACSQREGSHRVSGQQERSPLSPLSLHA